MKFLVAFIILFIPQLLIAQSFPIKGVVKNEKSNDVMPFVNILLLSANDSSQVSGSVSDIDGTFELSSIKRGSYILRIQFIGYRELTKVIELTEPLNLGNLYIREEATDLNEVVVQARRSTGTQKGDTTLFNADAFKTMKDASAQALIEKLPGVSSDGGILQAQGENIAQILVDGKPFFGTDVTAALQNIPAEMIQSIEIFDQLSEKAQLSGFDDGQRLKTINIITRPDKRKGQFGKTTAGYGSDERYLAGASINVFDGDTRLTFTGLTNNVNILNYSADPNAQTNASPQEGVITTNLFGVNYTDTWGEKIKVSGSYVFTKTENLGIESRIREFITSEVDNQFYRENSRDIRINNRHQADLRLEYKINERNKILYIPRFSARYETEVSGFQGQTTQRGQLINAVENTRIGDYGDFDLFNRFFYSHQFKKTGRSLTTRLNFSSNWNRDESSREAVNSFFTETGSEEEILNQLTTRDRKGGSWNARLSYTEPLSEKSLLEVEYSIGNRKNKSDQLLFNVISDLGPTDLLSLDTALSNTFESSYLTNQLEWGYQYKTEKLRIQAELEYQDARLDNSQFFPNPETLNRVFRNFLPTARLEYKFSSKTNVQVDYDTYTNEPSVGQLQAAVNNNNPLQLRTGNPNLDQAFTNQVRLRFRSNNPDKDQNWFLFSQARVTNNFISNSTFIADSPIDIGNGIILQQGAQLNRPVNLDGFKEFRTWFSYGIPLGLIKSNLSINTGLGITQRPGQINGDIGFNNSNRYSAGFNLSSNISETVDFTLWSRSSINQVNNTLNPRLNNDFFQQRFRFNLNWIIWKGIIYRMDVNHQINNGLADGFDATFTLINMSLGKKIFKNQRGEISLMVYDLLGQNANVRRNITETFIEDFQSNVLQRYAMFTFTYNLRRFSKNIEEKEVLNMFSGN